MQSLRYAKNTYFYLFFFGLYWKMTPKMSFHTVIQAFQHPGEAERYAGCFSFIVSPNKPISYKLFPYLSCHVQLPRKTAGKQSVNSKQPISPEQCATLRREREIKGRRAGGRAGGRQRGSGDAAKGPREKKEGGTFRSHRGEELWVV